jgi:predicted nucleic acid-binding protein
MRRVFADTYYWIALLNDKDQGHAQARAVSGTLQAATLVTTQEVLSEVLTYFSQHGLVVRQSAVAFVRSILVTVHGARRGTGTFFPADRYAMAGEIAERVGTPREK